MDPIDLDLGEETDQGHYTNLGQADDEESPTKKARRAAGCR